MSVELQKVHPFYTNENIPLSNYGKDDNEEASDHKTDLSSFQKVDLETSCISEIHLKEANKEEEEHQSEKEGLNSKGLQCIENVLQNLRVFYTTYNYHIWMVTCVIFTVLYFVYFGFAMAHKFGDEGSIRLLVITVLVSVLITVQLLKSQVNFPRLTHNISKFMKSHKGNLMRTAIRWSLCLVAVAFFLWIFIDVSVKSPNNLIALAGLVLYIFIFFVTSFSPVKVNWHTVSWGFIIQLVFAVVIIRTVTGYALFKWLGDRVSEFLKHTDVGSKFVFGDKYIDHIFAFKVLPVIIFFSSFISVLYYCGIMQVIIGVIGRFLAFCMGTTPAESINAAANIFIGMSEAPLMIKPFLEDMTNSELHAVLTGGFATIAGSVLGLYISYGVPANHLLSASVMSAPAALAISKLAYPEVAKSKSSSKDYNKMGKGTEKNVIEAASNGASNAILLVANVAVNVLAFISILAFINATLNWFGDRVGIEKLSFQLICSYVLFPFAYLMGVEYGDCRQVAQLLGVKIFLNELIAYSDLSVFIKNREIFNNYTSIYNATNTSVEYIGDDIRLIHTNTILNGSYVSMKSEVISTYALCGFSNVGSMGILLGSLSAMVPNRKQDLSKLIVRAMIAGNVACFITACIAGFLYRDETHVTYS